MLKALLFVTMLAVITGMLPAVRAEAGFGVVPERKTAQSEAAKTLIDLLPLKDYTLLSPDEVSGEALFRWYKAAYDAGKMPLIIAADDNLCFTIDTNLKEKGVSAILEAAEERFAAEYEGEEPPRPAALTLPESVFPDHTILTLHQGEWLLALLDADAPWQALSFVPFGGWNECPLPEDQAAILRGWQHRFGALPFLMTYDSLILLVTRPPQGPAETLPLADELLDFCPDLEIVYESPEALAEALIDEHLWAFWWD